jgi:hypothetical protein
MDISPAVLYDVDEMINDIPLSALKQEVQEQSNPADVFSADELEEWALDNGFVKAPAPPHRTTAAIESASSNKIVTEGDHMKMVRLHDDVATRLTEAAWRQSEEQHRPVSVQELVDQAVRSWLEGRERDFTATSPHPRSTTLSS